MKAQSQSTYTQECRDANRGCYGSRIRGFEPWVGQSKSESVGVLAVTWDWWFFLRFFTWFVRTWCRMCTRTLQWSKCQKSSFEWSTSDLELERILRMCVCQPSASEIRVFSFVCKLAVVFMSWPLDQIWIWNEWCRSVSRRSTVELLAVDLWFWTSAGTIWSFDGRPLNLCRSTVASSQILIMCHFGRPLCLWRSFASLRPSLSHFWFLRIDRGLCVGRPL